MSDTLARLKAALAPDDQRFVMVRNLFRAEGEVIVVEDFFEELKAKVGNE